MLHKVGGNQRQHQHEEHLIHNHPEGSPETDIHVVVDEREYYGYGKHRDDVREEDVAGHRLQVTTQLARHDGCSTGAGADDARQDALHQDQVLALHVKAEDKCHQQCDQCHLEHRYPQVPHRRPHLMEVHPEERREQD